MSPLSHSIFFDNKMIAGSQFGVRCGSLAGSVIGCVDMNASGIRPDPAFLPGAGSAGYRIDAGQVTNQNFIINQVAGDDGPSFDYFGAPRPQGMGRDIGFHEVQPPF
jgi:hypothetical protein